MLQHCAVGSGCNLVLPQLYPLDSEHRVSHILGSPMGPFHEGSTPQVNRLSQIPCTKLVCHTSVPGHFLVIALCLRASQVRDNPQDYNVSGRHCRQTLSQGNTADI